ncbi:hypothetical protein OX284_016930 [Flavobacterium sp. SUN046]|uniref:hypothetical protein n=1 Tax=Flavobacterium sp. SUN046 TaxID=3002440 RepID=UPI002DBADC19|nr:hypothetical protein [Flavobacterium sp. SUN046]MEC4051122.1 hypothetical protein [Flavobacterium sp. SUN046]
MKKILLYFLLASTILVNAQEDKTVTLSVTGTGKNLEEAKTNALRSAIEQAFGAFISSKTEILNDSLISDQIISVANGNIKSFEMLNESHFPDGSWGVTLKAIVSVSKLSNFVEAKGITIEIKGGMFALNIKQQILNEQGEMRAVSEMVGLLHEPMQISFDYVIKSSEPKSLDAESKNWEIPLVVTATTNKNIDFCANFCIKTLEALSLSPEEVLSYQSLNKAVFSVLIKYNGETKTIYLRNQSSIKALKTLTSNWVAYTRLFTVQSGMDESYGNDERRIHVFSSSQDDKDYNPHYVNKSETINFLTTGQQAATFSWQDKRTLSEIENMTGYTVKPRGVVSQFKHGGFVVYEENGHGLIMSLFDFENELYEEARVHSDNFILNGYYDWRLPTLNELITIHKKMYENKIGGLNLNGRCSYWSSEIINDYAIKCYDFCKKAEFGTDNHYYPEKMNVRPVRSF